MKDKIAHFAAAFFVYGLSMLAIIYMFQNKLEWFQSIFFAVVMAFADLFILKKLRDRKNK
ncbi:hypothetical protein P3875_05160 [Myroides sp. JBRI-B21084]|uniref:hypothetical protein n=1 Tax=Myroides sp. JBRI-B21084 TaxID=3119977 RepID=UPI0026E17344|nr:hypothetical protein [Paenimyroides cloacae]WKW47453.1 hypothetical protein P3875_05160 [Paenimyroides cloacae]